MSALSLLKAIYSKPYAVIFIAATALSAHGLFIAAHQLGHITAWIAWAYVLIVDLLAVSAYRTWRGAGMRHWAGLEGMGAYSHGTAARRVVCRHGWNVSYQFRVPVDGDSHMEGEASTETRINLALREFADCLPRFSDGRIDYTESSTALVLNCIVYCQGCILLLKRSHEVGTYKGQWGAVTGFIDRPVPLRDIILVELREELALKEGDISSITMAEPYRFYDASISKTWLIHPVLVETRYKPSIRLDWEHTEYCWIKPSNLTALDMMPGQIESIQRALREIAH